MTLPTYQDLMLPALKLGLEDRKTNTVGEILADQFHLTAEKREQKIKSGLRVIDSRALWAVTYLAQAGLVERFKRGHYRITERGKQLLATNPACLTTKDLEHYAEFREFKRRSRQDSGDGSSDTAQGTEDETPDERIRAAVREIETNIKEELLERVLNQSPAFFEKLVVDVLSAMGYGSGQLAAAVGRSGDGGIDGVIYEDALGLDVVYVQAKRYSDNNIQRPAMQAFIGTLTGMRANKGVFVTTSQFSPGALEYLNTVPIRVVTIDGQQLVELMYEHDVGVIEKDTYRIKGIDENLFED